MIQESSTGSGRRSKKIRIKGDPSEMLWEEFQRLERKRRIQLIQELIPIGLMAVSEELQREVAELIDADASRLCHSDVAALRPPKIRAKGRFQSISRVVDWANRMAEILAGAGRPTKGSLRERVLHAMPKLTAMRFFFARFSRDCAALNSIMELLKTRGLNQETHKAAVKLLRALPERSRISRSVKAWLDESLRTHCRLSIGQTPLLVSTDALESLYGLVKMIIERLPAPEFGTLSLATPLFCGNLTEHIVREALERCPHERLTEWKSENLGHTKRRVQSRLLEEMRRNTGPDPEPAVSA